MNIQRFSRHDKVVHIEWNNGTTNVFHYVWLRYNCPTARDPITTECILDALSIPLDITPSAVTVSSDGALVIEWSSDGHESRYDAFWLYRNAYAPKNVENVSPPLTLWTAETMSEHLPQADFHEVMDDDNALLSWLQLIHRYGFTLIRNVPTEPRSVLRLAGRVGAVAQSNFGDVFDVLSEPEPECIAYSSRKLFAHMDGAHRELQCGLQFLHCLVNEAVGGEAFVVDGFAAAEELKRTYPDDYELLSTTRVLFRYQGEDTDISAKAPIIGVDGSGRYTEIRYSHSLLYPLDIDHDLVEPFYRAYQQFTRIVRDSRFEFQFRFQAGDCELTNNRRVLHGRESYEVEFGRRHLQCCYLDTDEFLSRIRVLSRDTDYRDQMSIVRR